MINSDVSDDDDEAADGLDGEEEIEESEREASVEESEASVEEREASDAEHIPDFDHHNISAINAAKRAATAARAAAKRAIDTTSGLAICGNKKNFVNDFKQAFDTLFPDNDVDYYGNALGIKSLNATRYFDKLNNAKKGLGESFVVYQQALQAVSEQATDAANQATDAAKQATDAANQATDAANQATDARERALYATTDAADDAADAARDAAKAANGTANYNIAFIEKENAKYIIFKKLNDAARNAIIGPLNQAIEHWIRANGSTKKAKQLLKSNDVDPTLSQVLSKYTSYADEASDNAWNYAINTTNAIISIIIILTKYNNNYNKYNDDERAAAANAADDAAIDATDNAELAKLAANAADGYAADAELAADAAVIELSVELVGDVFNDIDDHPDPPAIAEKPAELVEVQANNEKPAEIVEVQANNIDDPHDHPAIAKKPAEIVEVQANNEKIVAKEGANRGIISNVPVSQAEHMQRKLIKYQEDNTYLGIPNKKNNTFGIDGFNIMNEMIKKFKRYHTNYLATTSHGLTTTSHSLATTSHILSYNNTDLKKIFNKSMNKLIDAYVKDYGSDALKTMQQHHKSANAFMQNLYNVWKSDLIDIYGSYACKAIFNQWSKFHAIENHSYINNNHNDKFINYNPQLSSKFLIDFSNNGHTPDSPVDIPTHRKHDIVVGSISKLPFEEEEKQFADNSESDVKRTKLATKRAHAAQERAHAAHERAFYAYERDFGDVKYDIIAKLHDRAYGDTNRAADAWELAFDIYNRIFDDINKLNTTNAADVEQAAADIEHAAAVVEQAAIDIEQAAKHAATKRASAERAYDAYTIVCDKASAANGRASDAFERAYDANVRASAAYAADDERASAANARASAAYNRVLEASNLASDACKFVLEYHTTNKLDTANAADVEQAAAEAEQAAAAAEQAAADAVQAATEVEQAIYDYNSENKHQSTLGGMGVSRQLIKSIVNIVVVLIIMILLYIVLKQYMHCLHQTKYNMRSNRKDVRFNLGNTIYYPNI